MSASRRLQLPGLGSAVGIMGLLRTIMIASYRYGELAHRVRCRVSIQISRVIIHRNFSVKSYFPILEGIGYVVIPAGSR